GSKRTRSGARPEVDDAAIQQRLDVAVYLHLRIQRGCGNSSGGLAVRNVAPQVGRRADHECFVDLRNAKPDAIIHRPGIRLDFANVDEPAAGVDAGEVKRPAGVRYRVLSELLDE